MFARLTVFAAGIVGVVVPLVLAIVTDGLSIPHNDAWAYSRIAQVFGASGHIQLLGWNRSALFGQFMVLGPLAQWLVVQHLFVALLAVVALAAVYDLVVDSVGRMRAAFAAFVVAIWPGFGLLATSFMPDVPAMTAILVCLAVGRRALRKDSWLLLAVSIGVGLWGFTIREQAIAAPVAVLTIAGFRAWRSGRGRDRLGVVALAAVAVVGALVFEWWRQTFPGVDPPVVAVPADKLDVGGKVLAQGFFVLALGLAPAVLLVARPWRWRLGAVCVAAVVTVAAVVRVRSDGAQKFFVGNYLDPDGPYWAAGIGRPAAIFPAFVWWLLVAVACVSGVLLAGVLVQRYRQWDPVLGAFVVLTVLGNVGSALTGQLLYDRYWLLILPALLAVVLSKEAESHRSSQLAAGVVAVGLSVVAVVISAAGYAYDSARWDAAEQVVATTGVSDRDVNAGLEWNGWHSAVGMSPPASWQFPGSRPCFTVSAEERTAEPAVLVWTYRPLVVAGNARLWVYGQPCS